MGSVKREGARRGIRKGRKVVFNDRIVPFTRNVKPGQFAVIQNNTHNYYVIVVLDGETDGVTVPRHTLDPINVLDKIVEAIE